MEDRKIVEYCMDAGAVYGVGMKGKVMDYGTKTHDMDSLQHTPLERVKQITLYVLEKNRIVEQKHGPDILEELVHYDTHQQYVIKEFMMPNVAQRALGYTKQEYMARELAGFQSILPIVKKHQVVGMPYHHTLLFGFEIEMTRPGYIYDGSTTRCFVINRKCKEVMKESLVNTLREAPLGSR